MTGSRRPTPPPEHGAPARDDETPGRVLLAGPGDDEHRRGDELSHDARLGAATPGRRAAAALASAFADGLGDVAATLGLGDGEVPGAVVADARAAGRRFVAAQRWAQLTGDRVDTATLRGLLGVSRQAIGQRVAAGTLIAVAGSGTSWYPTWQFRTVEGTDRLEVRPVIAALVQAFRDELGDQLDPLTLVGWAASAQPELDDQAPRAWVAAERDPDAVVVAAKRAAAELAR